MEIKKEQFERMDQDSRIITIYDAIISLEDKINIVCDNQKIVCDNQKKIKIRNSFYAFAGGIIGGMIVIISNWAFWGRK